jgi:glycosidase
MPAGGDAPEEAADVVHRLSRLLGWLDHLVSLSANVLVLNPIFDSVSHGYDTLDHRRVDPRLGDAEDLEALIAACHARGIKLVLDGVFNHLSAQHPIVRRASEHGPDSPEGAWIRWSGDHPYGFEGNADLVELDLTNPAVQHEIAGVMNHWLDRGIDGWRLDAMYAAGADTWRPILEEVRTAHPAAWILGEVIHGDYAEITRQSGANSLTQYELWKAIWSSIASSNLYELAHALVRDQEFRDRAPASASLTFLGNHDTTRIASQLPDGRDLVIAVTLLALLPGIPCIYAADEFGASGIKEQRSGGDDAVRPVFPDSPADVGAGPVAEAGQAADAVAPDEATFPQLALLKPEATERILEIHRRLFALRRREGWLSEARVDMPQADLANTHGVIELRSGNGSPVQDHVRLALNLGEDPVPCPAGEMLLVASGAQVLDGTDVAVGLTEARLVPPHGLMLVRA